MIFMAPRTLRQEQISIVQRRRDTVSRLKKRQCIAKYAGMI